MTVGVAGGSISIVNTRVRDFGGDLRDNDETDDPSVVIRTDRAA